MKSNYKVSVTRTFCYSAIITAESKEEAVALGEKFEPQLANRCGGWTSVKANAKKASSYDMAFQGPYMFNKGNLETFKRIDENETEKEAQE